MRRHMSRDGVRGSGEAGAVAVEFALVLSLLVLILFGVFEFGLAWSKVQVFEGAAREGARCAAVRAAEASVGLPVCDVEIAVKNASGGYTPSLTNFSISVSPSGGGECTADTIGEEVTVGWDEDLKINIPFWKDVTVTRTVEGTFRCE